MIQSGGVLVKGSERTLWSGTTAQWHPSLQLGSQWATYGEIYRRQLWVYVVVRKLARAQARLPLKVYEHDELNRPEATESPYARLIRRPNPRMGSFAFWEWVGSTKSIYGEAFAGKERDRGGRPVAVHPLHPTKLVGPEDRNGRLVYTLKLQSGDVEIDESDLIAFRDYNPDSMTRGMSPLEPLRSTLENEDAARRATSAFWRNAGRPSVVLTTKERMSGSAIDRVKQQWQDIHTGVDNFAKTAILEEGLKPERLMLTAEEAQYIDSRKLNREEVCGAMDVPPPVVHILDRATFSNITEQMRSMYRDTMAPRLKADEEVLETQLRGSVRPGATEPDFGDDVYAEFLMDEVLRGDFEARQDALDKASYMTFAEKRKLENLPYIEGTDRILVNSTYVPLDALDDVTAARAERRIPADVVRTLMGRLSRQKTIDEVDVDQLVDGLNGHSPAVLAVLDDAKQAGDDVAGLRARIKTLEVQP